ncbi:MAG: arylamine N-acetyltransferase [Cellvibrio sp.]|nr:arylamine N-acetyltransferase [Cellvibrio sp.]
MTLPNYFNSTHPDTIFVQKLLVVKHNPDGRSILLDNQLKRYVKSRVEVTEINREEIPAILKSEFEIDYPAI